MTEPRRLLLGFLFVCLFLLFLLFCLYCWWVLVLFVFFFWGGGGLVGVFLCWVGLGLGVRGGLFFIYLFIYLGGGG